QARSKLENAIGLADSVKFNTAERAFRIFSESYDRANAEYKRNLAEYMSAHDAYTLRVEEAAERVEQLLICEPEQVVSKPVVAVARTVSASTRQTLLEGLPDHLVHHIDIDECHVWDGVRGLNTVADRDHQALRPF
ncbi:hypothetical protein GGH15_005706, partial [Coemansia sp. RSA 562]